MKSICPYSGLEHVTHAFKGINVTSPHPVFYYPTDKLLFLAARWNEDHVTWDEKKLLFTAMLHATKLVTFKAPININVETLYKYIDRLREILFWKSSVFAPKPYLSKIGFSYADGKPRNGDFDYFPNLVIDASVTSANNNIGLWIFQLEDIRQQSETGRSKSVENRMTPEARAKQDELRRIVRNSMMQSKSGIERKLGVFAINAAPPKLRNGAIDTDLREYWLSLFTIKAPAIFRVAAIDFEELIEHMVAKLHHGDIGGHHILKHLRAQLKLCKSDEAAYFGIDDISTETNTQYMDELAEAARTAPVLEPVRNDFPNDLAFIKARSIWRLAQEQGRVAAKKAAENAFRIQETTLAHSFVSEDAMEDSTVNDIVDAGISFTEVIEEDQI